MAEKRAEDAAGEARRLDVGGVKCGERAHHRISRRFAAKNPVLCEYKRHTNKRDYKLAEQNENLKKKICASKAGIFLTRLLLLRYKRYREVALLCARQQLACRPQQRRVCRVRRAQAIECASRRRRAPNSRRRSKLRSQKRPTANWR